MFFNKLYYFNALVFRVSILIIFFYILFFLLLMSISFMFLYALCNYPYGCTASMLVKTNEIC
jgi:hypothetical protein